MRAVAGTMPPGDGGGMGSGLPASAPEYRLCLPALCAHVTSCDTFCDNSSPFPRQLARLASCRMKNCSFLLFFISLSVRKTSSSLMLVDDEGCARTAPPSPPWPCPCAMHPHNPVHVSMSGSLQRLPSGKANWGQTDTPRETDRYTEGNIVG